MEDGFEASCMTRFPSTECAAMRVERTSGSCCTIMPRFQLGKMLLLPEDDLILPVEKKPSTNMPFLETNLSPIDELLAFHRHCCHCPQESMQEGRWHRYPKPKDDEKMKLGKVPSLLVKLGIIVGGEWRRPPLRTTKPWQLDFSGEEKRCTTRWQENCSWSVMLPLLPSSEPQPVSV